MWSMNHSCNRKKTQGIWQKQGSKETEKTKSQTSGSEWGVLGSPSPGTRACACLCVSQWRWLQRIFGSWWKTFCDANRSSWYVPVRKNEPKRAIVVVRFLGFGVLRLVMGLWMTAGPLIVSSALLRPPMSQSERLTYSNTDSHQPKIAHKGQMTRLMHGDDSVNTPENENHFNLFSWKKKERRQKNQAVSRTIVFKAAIAWGAVISRPRTFSTFE